jgi:heme-degrading monooxygenase HmoA
MIEVFVTYDLLPNVDQKSYVQLLKKAIVPILSQPGIVEIRARRSLSGSPEVLILLVWETLADWNKFEIKKEWAALKAEVTDAYATNMTIQVWGPSPIAPEPLRPLR